MRNPPAGKQRIIPMLNYADAPAAIDFLVRAFGFRERRVYPMPVTAGSAMPNWRWATMS